jgi:hypothetical protein
MLGSWNTIDQAIELDISVGQLRAVICMVFSDNFKKEFEVLKITSSGAPVQFGLFDNCDASKRSVAMVLPRGSRYLIRPKFVNSTCANGLPTAQTPMVPTSFSDNPQQQGRVTYWEWDFSPGGTLEKAGLTIMLVDNNMGGKVATMITAPFLQPALLGHVNQ